MGTRVEIHCFGAGGEAALPMARRTIEAVDDALTIHRPSSATVLNDQLASHRQAVVDDPILFDALLEIDTAHAATNGLFDPAAGSAGWGAVLLDRTNRRITTSRSVAFDFGGFGKGFALDRACAALRAAGVCSAILSAGESSISVIGEHPLGGGWPFSIPHPLFPDRSLVDIELNDEALSISSTVGANSDASGRAPMIRPTDGARITSPRLSIAVEQYGAVAEAMSTALLVADTAQVPSLIVDPDRQFCFDFHGEDVMGASKIRMVL